MSAAQVMVSIPDEVKKECQIFRLRKNKTLDAFLLKINKTKQEVEIEETWEDTNIEEIANEIPAQQPRYVVISYPVKWDDGRQSYPLLFVFISPQGCHPELQMLYAGSKQSVVHTLSIPKTMELRSLDDFTDENVQAVAKKM